METAFTVAQQVLIIIALLAVGAAAFKTKLIGIKAADDMAAFALKIVTPCVIIKAFQIDYNADKLKNMIIAALLAILTHLVGMAIAKLVFRKKTEGNRVRSFVTVYCNCGFMGIPLIEGAVGAEGVIYSSIYIMVFQALLWSHGIITIKGGRDAIKPYKIFVNAGTIGIALGLPLFLLSISLPPVISDTVSHIANLNTPLAMIISGVYVANSNIKRAFTRPKNYLCVAMRQIAVPLVMMGILLLIPADPIVEITILIISACPVASAVTLFAAIYGKESDLECASRALTLSTLLSVVTIPAITLLYGVLVK